MRITGRLIVDFKLCQRFPKQHSRMLAVCGAVGRMRHADRSPQLRKLHSRLCSNIMGLLPQLDGGALVPAAIGYFTAQADQFRFSERLSAGLFKGLGHGNQFAGLAKLIEIQRCIGMQIGEIA